MNLTPIREYEQACYIYWLGPNLPTVKIGMSNEPARRLEEFRRETGTPGHLAAFAAIVWLDRGMGRVERAAHTAAHTFRRDGEWFELPATEALNYVVAAAESLGIRYEVEDRAGVWAATLARREAERRAELIRRIGEASADETGINAWCLDFPDLPDQTVKWATEHSPTTNYSVAEGWYFDFDLAQQAHAMYLASGVRCELDWCWIEMNLTQAWLNSPECAERVPTERLAEWLEHIEYVRNLRAEEAAAANLAENLARQAERDAAAAAERAKNLARQLAAIEAQRVANAAQAERDAAAAAAAAEREAAAAAAAAEREAAAAAARHAASVAKVAKNRRTLFGRIFG